MPPAHLNLVDEYLPYKHLIGQLILDVSYTGKDFVMLKLEVDVSRKTRKLPLLSIKWTVSIQNFVSSRWN